MAGVNYSGSGGGFRFVTSFNHQWTMQPTDAEKEQYPQLIKERETKSGKTVEYIATDYIQGRIINVEEREVPFDPGKINSITIEDDEGVKFRVDLNYQGRGILDFMKRLPNVREDQEVQFGVFGVDVPGKNGKEATKRSQIYIRQRDENGEWSPVKNAFPFDPENPSASPMPPFRSYEGKGGKTEWDPTPQYDWLIQNPVLDYMGRISKLSAAANAEAAAKAAEGPAPAATKVPENVSKPTGTHTVADLSDEDDLPF